MVENYSLVNGERFLKKNVYAYELEGCDWDDAPHLLSYIHKSLSELPSMFNKHMPELQISTKVCGILFMLSVRFSTAL